MGMGTLGVRVRYKALNEDQFKVEALLPIEENKDAWQAVGTASRIEYEDGEDAWEFEAENGRTSEGRDRRTATGRAMMLMGYAIRLGDVLEDIPREERNRGRRTDAQ